MEDRPTTYEAPGQRPVIITGRDACFRRPWPPTWPWGEKCLRPRDSPMNLRGGLSEEDTPAELAAAAEVVLNEDYSVLLVTPFPPQITATRGQSKHFGMHILLYGEPIV